MNKRQGFTLMETMTLVAVILILIALSFPSYRSFVRQTRLEHVHEDLLVNAQLLNRFYRICYTYKPLAGTEAPCHQEVPLRISPDNARYFFIEHGLINNDHVSPGKERFVLVARPRPGTGETRYLKYDSVGGTFLCRDMRNGAPECIVYR